MESTSSEPIFKALIHKGWCLKDVEAIRALCQIKVPAQGSEMGSLESIQSELLNMDLREMGGKSLPDPSSLNKSSHLQGPKILQAISYNHLSLSHVLISVSCL